MKNTLLTLLLLPLSALSQNSEASHRDKWARALNGEIEVRMGDGSRCDIVTQKYAIEVEWASKWKDAVGQSLWYSFQSGKEAAIILILDKPEDRKHLIKLNSLILDKKLPIKVLNQIQTRER